MGWSRTKNGQLLDAAEQAGFKVLLSGDQTLKYEQKHEWSKNRCGLDVGQPLADREGLCAGHRGGNRAGTARRGSPGLLRRVRPTEIGKMSGGSSEPAGKFPLQFNRACDSRRESWLDAPRIALRHRQLSFCPLSQAE